MALYSVERTDRVMPGEFVSGLVIANGTAIARAAFADEPGVTGKNLKAERIDTRANNGVVKLTNEWEPSLPAVAADAPEYLYDSGSWVSGPETI